MKDYAKMHEQKKAKAERLKDSIKIPYPSKMSEVEVTFYLMMELKKLGKDVRAEVTAQNLKSRFDLVIFDEKKAVRIIEVKRSKKVKPRNGQIKQYKEYKLPVSTICGIGKAKQFIENEIKRQDTKTRGML